MGFNKRLARTVFGTITALGLTVSIAQADAIADRQKAMKQVGDAMKALAGMAKGEVAFDAAATKSNVEKMASQFEAAKSLFPEGSETGGGDKPTRAKPEIWQDKDGFLKLLDDSIVLANAVAGASDMDSLRPVLGNLGNKSCKACHEKFRKPKE